MSHWFKEATLAEVARSMVALGEAGSASFNFDLQYKTASDRITHVELTMRLSMTMPVWSKYSRRPKRERDEWDRFYKALRYHEDGHIKIFRDEAPTTHEKLERATPATIGDVLDDETARIQKLSDDYDHRTGHGVKQATPHGTTVIQLP